MEPNEYKPFDPKSLSQKIKELRESKHLTQQEVASSLLTTQQTVQRYENGDRIPDIGMLYRMSLLFEVSVDYLIGLSSAQSIEGDLKVASETTGLSEDAIKNIQSMADLPAGDVESDCAVYSLEALDCFLKSDFLFVFSFNIANCIANTKKFLKVFLENPYVNPKYNKDNFIESDYAEALDNFITNVEFCEFKTSQLVNNMFKINYIPIYEDIKKYWHQYKNVLLNIEENEEVIKEAMKKFADIKKALKKEGFKNGEHTTTKE